MASASPGAAVEQGRDDVDATADADLPVSAKYVRWALDRAEEAPLSQSDLVDRTQLSRRTVRYAVGRLREQDLLEREKDGKFVVYRLADRADSL